jgi:hypothetical protein
MYVRIGMIKSRRNCRLFFCFTAVFFLLSSSGCSVDENNESYKVVGPPVDIYERKITVDGETDDWGDLVAQAVDPSGDCLGFSGLDITGIYVAKDEDSLFIRVSSVGNDLPSWSTTWFNFDRAFNGDYTFAVEFVRENGADIDVLLWNTSAGKEYNDYVRIPEGITQIKTGDKDIEVAINLASIDLQPFHRLWFYAQVDEGEVVDSLDDHIILNCRPE